MRTPYATPVWMLMSRRLIVFVILLTGCHSCENFETAPPPAGTPQSFPLTISTSVQSLQVRQDGRFTLRRADGTLVVASTDETHLFALSTGAVIETPAFDSAVALALSDAKLGTGHRITGNANGSRGRVSINIDTFDLFPEAIVLSGSAIDDSLSVSEIILASMALNGRTNNDTRILYGPTAGTLYMDDFTALPPLRGYQKTGDMLKGGTPLNAVWTRTSGVALSVIEPTPVHVALPLSVTDAVQLSVSYRPKSQYSESNTSISTPRAMLTSFQGDYYDPLRTLSSVMSKLGGFSLNHDNAPDAAYGPLWKTWGLSGTTCRPRPACAASPSCDHTPDPSCKLKSCDSDGCWIKDSIRDLIPDIKTLGFKTILLDFDWFNAEGDWTPKNDPVGRFSNEADLTQFISELHGQNFNVGLWYQPIQLNPEAENYDELKPLAVLDESGKRVVDDDGLNMLDPALPATRDLVRKAVQKFAGWGADYLYIDSQEAQLAVRPDFRQPPLPGGPLDSFFALPAIYKLMRDSVSSSVVIESCPDGRNKTIYQMPYYEVNNVGDPGSDMQARHETKLLKALRGDRSPVGVYVDPFNDNAVSGDPATAVGPGAIVMSFFSAATLASERRATLQAWMSYVATHHPERGTYRNLYDVGFDEPEGHAIGLSNGAMQFSFFTRYDARSLLLGATGGENDPKTKVNAGPETFSGNVELRGLTRGTRYRVTEVPSGDAISAVTADAQGKAMLPLDFTRSKVILAEP